MALVEAVKGKGPVNVVLGPDNVERINLAYIEENIELVWAIHKATSMVLPTSRQLAQAVAATLPDTRLKGAALKAYSHDEAERIHLMLSHSKRIASRYWVSSRSKIINDLKELRRNLGLAEGDGKGQRKAGAEACSSSDSMTSILDELPDFPRGDESSPSPCYCGFAHGEELSPSSCGGEFGDEEQHARPLEAQPRVLGRHVSIDSVISIKSDEPMSWLPAPGQMDMDETIGQCRLIPSVPDIRKRPAAAEPEEQPRQKCGRANPENKEVKEEEKPARAFCIRRLVEREKIMFQVRTRGGKSRALIQASAVMFQSEENAEAACREFLKMFENGRTVEEVKAFKAHLVRKIQGMGDASEGLTSHYGEAAVEELKDMDLFEFANFAVGGRSSATHAAAGTAEQPAGAPTLVGVEAGTALLRAATS